MVPIRAQFRRRRKHAKLGHLLAAEEFEKHLSQVASGSQTLESLCRWKRPKQTMETNESSKKRLWQNFTHQRRLDSVNIAPQPGTLEYARVHTAAQLCNSRALLLKNRSIKGPFDPVVVDTVLASYQRKQIQQRAQKHKVLRESTPRQVQTKTFRRDGARIMILHTQGIKSPRLRFSALINAVNRNSRRCIRLRKKHTAFDAKRLVQFKEMQSAQYGVLMRRLVTRQRYWDYHYKLKKQNKLVRTHKLRLADL